MYSIYSDGICIHSAKALTKEHKLLNPKLTLTDNAAGSLDITVPPGNAGYDKIERISSELVVKRNDVELWSGRVITEKGDFWNQRMLTCEGELAYLNDTHQEPASYNDIDVGDFLTAILDFHNSKVGEDKQFILGAVTVHENITCTTNYETTLDCINENVINKLGGHISIRKENGVRYIDYFEDYMNTNTQTIQFGKNLVDFTKNWDMTSYATVIIPRGARLEDSPIEGLEAYLTVESVNAGSIYVTDENAIKERGWIEAVVDFENVTDPAELLEKARTYISDTQFENLIIEVSAVDLHYLMKSEEPIKLLDQVRCVSVPHGLDKIFPVSQLAIPIDHPENATYTLGSTIKTSLTSSNKKTNSEIMQKIENLPSKETILKKAAENAAEIMNQATNGHITITKIKNDNQTVTESLFITDTEDYRKATKAWRWNINGLAYYDTTNPVTKPIDYSVSNPKVAITMDGAIVADFITVGTMSADRIRTGILESSEEYSAWSSTKYYYRGDKVFHSGRYWRSPTYNTNRGIEPGVTYWRETTTTTGAVTFSYSTTYSSGTIVSYSNRYWVAQTTVKNCYPGTTYWVQSNKNVVFDLNAGSLTISSGKITLGDMDDTGNYKFQVDDDGYLHAYYGEIGAFTITDYSLYSNDMELNSYGIRWYKDSVNIGKQGTNNWVDDEDYRGLVFDMESEAQYISWSVREYSTDDYYTVKLIYTKDSKTSNGERYRADRLNICCDSDFHDWLAYNCWIDPDTGGANGGGTYEDGEKVKLGIVNSSGSVTGWIEVRIINGFIIP